MFVDREGKTTGVAAVFKGEKLGLDSNLGIGASGRDTNQVYTPTSLRDKHASGWVKDFKMGRT